MPYTTVVAATTITAAWANANIRDQVVTPFTTAGTRGSGITAPVAGMVTTLTSTAVGVYQYTTATTGWRAPWNLPWGCIAQLTDAGTQATSSTSFVDIETLSWTAVTNRRYLLTCSFNVFLGASFTGQVCIANSANTQLDTWFSENGSATFKRTLLANLTGLSGAQTMKLRGETSSGGTLTFNGSALQATATLLMVEDIGPSNEPA